MDVSEKDDSTHRLKLFCIQPKMGKFEAGLIVELKRFREQYNLTKESYVSYLFYSFYKGDINENDQIVKDGKIYKDVTKQEGSVEFGVNVVGSVNGYHIKIKRSFNLVVLSASKRNNGEEVKSDENDSIKVYIIRPTSDSMKWYVNDKIQNYTQVYHGGNTVQIIRSLSSPNSNEPIYRIDKVTLEPNESIEC